MKFKEQHEELMNSATKINNELFQVNQDIDVLKNKSEHIHTELKQNMDQIRGMCYFRQNNIL